ncbi:MAG: FAD:protein FMN transferase [Anaerolineaceae bacterium]|nr:FAD:protein FMN transferase [Anaerolineaceae bacterium]
MEMQFSEQFAVQSTHLAMGTVMTHKAFGTDAEESLTAAQMEIERLEALFSRFRPGSDISRINQAAGIGRVQISEETMQVLQTAQAFTQQYADCFDITITPLVDLWRKAAGSKQVPQQASIKAALALVNAHDLLLNPGSATAELRRTQQCLDLGGIAKGYAANHIREIFTALAVQSACANLGGNVIALGCKPDGSSWKVGIQHPRREQALLGMVSVDNQCVVTSGDYQRYFIGKDGKRYHHILNPNTGYPTESNLLSVSIITRDAMTADALSTMVFIAGLEKGLKILANHPECEAILVDQNCQIILTKGLHDQFIPLENTTLTIVAP